MTTPQPEWAVNTEADLRRALDGISFRNTVLDFRWRFQFEPAEVRLPGCAGATRHGWLVWVTFQRPDTETGQAGRGRGRDEIVWEGTTVSGVVKTAWLLVELMVRHELMEGFRWDGARIFNPHNSVLDLAELQRRHAERLGESR